DIVSLVRHVRYGPLGDRDHIEGRPTEVGLRLRSGVELNVEQSPSFRIMPRHVFRKHLELAPARAAHPTYIRMQAYLLQGKTGHFRASFMLVGKPAALGCG